MLATQKTSSNFQLRPKIDNKKFLKFFLRQNHDDLKNKTARNFQHLPTFFSFMVSWLRIICEATLQVRNSEGSLQRDKQQPGTSDLWGGSGEEQKFHWLPIEKSYQLIYQYIYIYILMFCLGGYLLEIEIYHLFTCWGGVWSLNFWDSKMTPWSDDSLKKKSESVPFLRRVIWHLYW